MSWRVGSKVGRTLYCGHGPDDLIGVMDTRELAAEVVADHELVALMLAVQRRATITPLNATALTEAQIALFRGYAGRAFTLDELRDLFSHIDALAAENDAAERRLAAAEAGIAAEIATSRQELKRLDASPWVHQESLNAHANYIKGLEIAARIVAREETP